MERIRRYLALAAAFAVAIFAYLFRRRGQEIADLKTELELQSLRAQTSGLETKLGAETKDAHDAQEDYDSVRRRNADVLARFGVGREPEKPSK